MIFILTVITKQQSSKASLNEPSAGEMAVFYIDTQLSETVTAEDGIYIMETDTALLPKGTLNKKAALTVKFIENNTISGAREDVDVTVTADAELAMPDGTTRYVVNLWDAFKVENSGVTVTLIKDVEGSIDIFNYSNSDTNLKFTTFQGLYSNISASPAMCGLSGYQG